MIHSWTLIIWRPASQGTSLKSHQTMSANVFLLSGNNAFGFLFRFVWNVLLTSMRSNLKWSNDPQTLTYYWYIGVWTLKCVSIFCVTGWHFPSSRSPLQGRGKQRRRNQRQQRKSSYSPTSSRTGDPTPTISPKSKCVQETLSLQSVKKRGSSQGECTPSISQKLIWIFITGHTMKLYVLYLYESKLVSSSFRSSKILQILWNGILVHLYKKFFLWIVE